MDHEDEVDIEELLESAGDANLSAKLVRIYGLTSSEDEKLWLRFNSGVDGAINQATIGPRTTHDLAEHGNSDEDGEYL